MTCGVAVVAAGGWVAALGRGQVVLTATRDEASASVTVEVGHAIPATRPQRPPAPAVEADEAEPARRARWRRKGSRLRRAVLQGGAGSLAVAGTLYMFGGLKDFHWDRNGESTVPADTVAGIALARSGGKADSIPLINRGTDATPATTRRVRRRPIALSPASVSIAPQDAMQAGDTVTLTAEVLDAEGAPIAGAGVTWRSSEPDLASVDSGTGRVSARAPGTALITALSGDQLATTELRVLPSADAVADTQGYAPLSQDPSLERAPEEIAMAPTPTARATAPPKRTAAVRAPEPPYDHRELESKMRQGVDDCYGALRSKDVQRVTRIYRPKTYADEDKLTRLVRILRTEPWKASVGRRVDGAREMGATAAAAEFSFPLAWTGMHGGRLNSQPIFRAEFSRSGDAWTLSSCRIVGSPKL